jgi:hypothetical protein
MIFNTSEHVTVKTATDKEVNETKRNLITCDVVHLI